MNRMSFVVGVAVLCVLASGFAARATLETWSVVLNPASNTAPAELNGQLNPFAIPQIRLALNRAIDRVAIAGLYAGSKTADVMFTPVPFSRCCAGELLSADLGMVPSGDLANFVAEVNLWMPVYSAQKGATGLWEYKGAPVTVICVIRGDAVDGRREAAGQIADLLESVGFTVQRLIVNGQAAVSTVYNTDPVAGAWHVYVEGWAEVFGPEPELTRVAEFYSSGYPGMPGWNTAGYWQYADPAVDQLIQDLMLQVPSNGYERCMMLNGAVGRGLADSVRIFLASIE